MRIWSIHPQYLDSKGLVALWRETLLAQKVLLGQTKGYKNHPQLIRFKNSENPLGGIATYLRYVHEEAVSRGYKFDGGKIRDETLSGKINVNSGQVEYEFRHLLKKLTVRDRERFEIIKAADPVQVHPLFKKISGSVEEWEVQD